MVQDELIGPAQRLQRADEALGALVGGHESVGGDEAVVAAVGPVIGVVPRYERRMGIVAEIAHAFGDRLYRERHLMVVALVEDLRAVGIASRLDGREGGLRVLRGGEMLIEDHAAGKELCSARHMLRKYRTCGRPAKTVDEEIQHEFFARGTVFEEDRGADGKGSRSLGMQCRRLIEAEIAERPLAEIAGILFARRPNGEVLTELCPRHRHDDRFPLGHLDPDGARARARLLDIERDVPVVGNEVEVMAHGLVDARHRGKKALVDVGAHPEAIASCGHREGQLLADENIQLKAQLIILNRGAVDCERRIAGEICRHRKSAERLLLHLFRKCEAELLLRVHALDMPPHRDGVEFPSNLRIGGGEHLPYREVHGALLIGALPAENGGLGIPLRKQIARSKDVCALGVRRLLPIGGKLRQKIIVVCAAL